MMDFKKAADAAIVKYRKLWEEERARLDELLSNHHQTPPNNYWIPEHRARALYIGAIQLRELLE